MGRTSVALASGRPEEPLLVHSLEAGKPQAEGLIPLIGELMAHAAIPFSALDRIAVCIGPGGFSGIRTGVAAARGIGLAAGVPVVGATSFRIMAAAFEKEEDVPAVYGLAAPAGSSAVFCQILSRNGMPLTEIVALPHSEAGAFFAEWAEVLAGPAAAALAGQGHVSLPVRAPALMPDAAALAGIAASLVPGRDLPSPHYVRPADARPQ
ncbi:MAG: tRNA (adenosine(37)-N6)-threonylcarbamoyltransferase complex dimerization subunit type 1 TsaB, partial [Rhodomicrobium sp.]|nr:tRNA (adenosine(37)-N6)-threonylcarbamoyltransferase complex dimerization subunit type 1 TsaB [Rhodomicrobium sp.]